MFITGTITFYKWCTEVAPGEIIISQWLWRHGTSSISIQLAPEKKGWTKHPWKLCNICDTLSNSIETLTDTIPFHAISACKTLSHTAGHGNVYLKKNQLGKHFRSLPHVPSFLRYLMLVVNKWLVDVLQDADQKKLLSFLGDPSSNPHSAMKLASCYLSMLLGGWNGGEGKGCIPPPCRPGAPWRKDRIKMC